MRWVSWLFWVHAGAPPTGLEHVERTGDGVAQRLGLPCDQHQLEGKVLVELVALQERALFALACRTTR